MLEISSNTQNLFSSSSATRGIPSFFSGNGANTAIFIVLSQCLPDMFARTISTEYNCDACLLSTISDGLLAS